MPPPNETFTVELLGFSPAISQVDASKALATVFGMDIQRAMLVVKQAPVRVKGGASPDVARRLATALLGIEANVRVTNELTGAAREYTAAGVSDEGPPSSLRAPPGVPSSVRPPTISYIPGELGAYVPPGAPDPRAVFTAMNPPRGAAEPAAPPSVRPAASASVPPQPGPSASVPPASGAPATSSRPPGSIPPGPGGTHTCSSCRRQHPAEAARCPRCGYSRKSHKHECPSCGGALVVAHRLGVVHHVPVVLLAGVAAAGFWFLGFATGLGLLLAPVAAVWLARALTVRSRCAKCTRPQDPEHVQPAVQKAITARRTLNLVAGVACAVLAAGPSLLYLSAPVLEQPAGAERLTATVPRTHRDLAQRPTDVSTPWGVAFGELREATNAHMPVELFRVLYVEFVNARVASASDRELLEATLAGAIDAVYAPPGAFTPVELAGKEPAPGLETTFAGRTGMHGRARIYRLDKGYVVAFFAGHGERTADRADGLAFLDSLRR